MNALHITRTLTAAAALSIGAGLLAGPVYAQAEGAPVSRASVSEEARAANMAGQLQAGEMLPGGAPQAMLSTKTREQRKAETMEARRKGEFQPGGMGSYKSNMSQQTATAKSTKTREQRKTETMEAIKQRKTMQPGEAA
jgi:hypothetical protein